MTDEKWAPTGIDTSKPSIARVYDVMLGGKDNFAVDRKVAELALRVAPDAPESALANREFLRRVVRYLTAEAGIRQFIDVGSGLPSQGNVHEVAQAIDPGTRVVYVDNDPIVLAHGRALLADNSNTTVIQADIRRPDEILGSAAVRNSIDLGQPVGLLLFAILHHLGDDEDPGGLAAHLLDALPPGSHIALSHFHNPGEARPEVAEQAAAAEKTFNENLGTGRWRTHDEILAYFCGHELVEPGLVPIAEWRPEPGDRARQGITYYTFVGGVARKA
ncbi:MAG: SAM-dependent methyltransferase [Actinomadura sp.]